MRNESRDSADEVEPDKARHVLLINRDANSEKIGFYFVSQSVMEPNVIRGYCN